MAKNIPLSKPVKKAKIYLMGKYRAKVYIDGANMLYSQKKMGWDVNWEALKDYLRERWDVREIRYYTGVKEGDLPMRGFIKYLEHLGFIAVTKKLKTIKIGLDHPMYKIHHYREIHKANLDIEMTTDILTELLVGKDNPDNIQEIILLSGDSDFKYLIDTLKKFEIGTTIVASKSTLAWEMKFAAAKIVKLEEIRETIEKKTPEA